MSAEPVDILKERAAVIKGRRHVDPLQALARSATTISLKQPDRPQGERDWKTYARAQLNEKPAFRVLLYELCRTLPEDGRQPRRGRQPIPYADSVFTCVYKSYIGLSGRRFMSDLEDAHGLGFLSQKVSYNTIFNKLAEPSLTPTLVGMIQGVAACFSHIETNFAVDSTGFRIPKITQWCDEKHGWRRRREWLKCHVTVGVRTHIVTAVTVTKRNVGDPRCFGPLMAETSEQFCVGEVAADRAYSTINILEQVDGMGALPAIPFKSNTNPYRHAADSVWRKMFHIFALNSREWQESVNRQNQVESTFSQIKRKFGEKVFSKEETAQVNEILCKVLCHNVCVLIYWLYEFGVEETVIGEAIGGEPEPPALPLQIDDPDRREEIHAVVDSMVNDNGMSYEQAWAVVRKLL